MLTLSQLLNKCYDKEPSSASLKEPCFRCGERFTFKDVGAYECPCGIVILEADLLRLEYAYRVPFLLKREVMIDEGWKKCDKCNGDGRYGIHACLQCFGVGAMERFDCNGNCWNCRKESEVKDSISSKGDCNLCDGHRTKARFDAAGGEG